MWRSTGTSQVRIRHWRWRHFVNRAIGAGVSFRSSGPMPLQKQPSASSAWRNTLMWRRSVSWAWEYSRGLQATDELCIGGCRHLADCRGRELHHGVVFLFLYTVAGSGIALILCPAAHRRLKSLNYIRTIEIRRSHIIEEAINNTINITIPLIIMRIAQPHEAPFFAPLIIASFSWPLFEKINPSNNPVNVSTKMNINPTGINTLKLKN